jgi:hypothetical protein
LEFNSLPNPMTVAGTACFVAKPSIVHLRLSVDEWAASGSGQKGEVS